MIHYFGKQSPKNCELRLLLPGLDQSKSFNNDNKSKKKASLRLKRRKLSLGKMGRDGKKKKLRWSSLPSFSQAEMVQ